MTKLPSVSNDMQSSETLRNSLGLNYKSAALNQLSYAGATPYESCFQWVDQEFVTTHFAHRAAKGSKISRADSPFQFGEEIFAIHLVAAADSFGSKEATIFPNITALITYSP